MCEIHNEALVIQNTIAKQKSNFIIFDVGGCNFHDSLYLKNIFPSAQIYSFEASRENLQSYKEIAERAGILVVPVAISNKNDVTKFYDSNNNGAGSLLKPLVKPGTNEGIYHNGVFWNMNGYEVQVVRIDTFCELNEIDHIDFLHVDVQGAEYLVIQGLGKLRPDFIFAETCEFGTYESGITLNDFDSYMNSLGYEIFNRFRDDTLYKLKDSFKDFSFNNWLPKI